MSLLQPEATADWALERTCPLGRTVNKPPAGDDGMPRCAVGTWLVSIAHQPRLADPSGNVNVE